MAKEVVKGATVIYGFTDLTSDLNAVALDPSAPEVDTTNLASGGWREVKQGIRMADWNFTGFLEADDTNAEPEGVLFDGVDAGTLIPVVLSKARPLTAGDIAFFQNSLPTYLTEKVKIGEAWGFEARMKGSTPAIRGKALEVVTRTSTGNSASLTMPAVATGERLYYCIAVLRPVVGTSPTLDLILQSDSSNSYPSPADRATLTQFTEHGFVFGYIDGPITDTEWRVAATVGGTDSPSFPYRAVIGIAPIF